MTRIATFLKPVPVATTALAAVAGAYFAWTPIAGAESTAPAPAVAAEPANAPGNAIVDLVARTSPAVVTVLATQKADTSGDGSGQDQGQDMSPFGPNSPFDEFMRRFGMPTPQQPGPRGQEQGPQGVALGSGFIVDPNGYIVTNNHVVDHADTVKVRLSDDREFDAKVLGTDEQSDLALLKIDATNLPDLTFGDSDKVRVGEDVIAVGNPFGLGGTVTRGIVSAMARDINSGPYVDFIQTDAAINRGNSGGPLLDLSGNVIGVNSAIYSPNGGSVGVGFAIPSNTVKTVIAQLRNSGSVERGWLGVTIQNVTPEIASALGITGEPHGALVSDVVPDGPSVGKLETGDVILSFDGKPVDSSRELPKLVAAAAPESTVKIEVLRQGKDETIDFTLGRFDAEKVASNEPSDMHKGADSERLGATLAPMTPTTREQLGIDDQTDGVVITSLDNSGRAADAGLEVGDVILKVGDTDVRTPSDVDHALHAVKGNAVLMQIERHGSRIFVGVKLA